MLVCKNIVAIIALFFFCACARYEPVNVSFEQKSYEISDNKSKYLLYISKNGNSYYFALQDMLGAPIVNRKFENSSFSNFKFARPNSSFDDLFYHLLEMQKEQKDEILYKNFKVKEVF